MLALLTLSNREFFESDQRRVAYLDRRDCRRRRRSSLQVANKGCEVFFWTLDVDVHSFFAVQYPSSEFVGLRQTINKWTEPHPLHDAAHANEICI